MTLAIYRSHDFQHMRNRIVPIRHRIFLYTHQESENEIGMLQVIEPEQSLIDHFISAQSKILDEIIITCPSNRSISVLQCHSCISLSRFNSE
jgi:hypothetical protein